MLPCRLCNYLNVMNAHSSFLKPDSILYACRRIEGKKKETTMIKTMKTIPGMPMGWMKRKARKMGMSRTVLRATAKQALILQQQARQRASICQQQPEGTECVTVQITSDRYHAGGHPDLSSPGICIA